MSRRARLLAAALAGTLLGAAPLPATAVPASLDLHLEPHTGAATVDQPFVGEPFTAESVSMETTGGRQNWKCEVDFGDGTTGGFWRAQPYDAFAPCAEHHTYQAAGTYTLVMKVTDNLGGTVTEQRVLEVGPRPTTTAAAGVEGSPVRLGVDPGVSTTWSFPRQSDNDTCDIARKPGPDVKVTCYDEGLVRVNYDTGEAATSGAYDITWTNGRPSPSMRSMRTLLRRNGSPYYVKVVRVGTGDQVRWDATANDPSTKGTKGDRITCRYDHGNGLREVQEAYVVKGTCNGQTSYLAPGTHTSRVRMTDEDGASGTAQAKVRVVRRDVHLAVRDVRRGGASGAITASLTPRGLRGRVSLRFPSGRSLVATRLTSIQVTDFGAVTLLGRAKVDGKTGYRFVAFPDASYPQGIAFSMLAWPVGKPRSHVIDQTIHRRDFRVRLHAPSVH